MKVWEFIKPLEGEGWNRERLRGSHRQHKHPVKKGLVTVPGKPNEDLQAGTLASIAR